MKRRALTWLLLCGISLTAAARDPKSVGLEMTDAAKNFLAALSPDEKAKVVMKFDDEKRLDWHNIPKPERKGLQMHDMSAEQRKLCWALLATSLSKTGYGKAEKILSLENNLREGEKELKNSPLRDPQRYFLTVFGQPDAKGTWGWSLEGHHFSQNFVIRDGRVVADTPSFWGANPATVHLFIEGGPVKETRTLAQEEQLAFDLVNLLDADQKKKAIIAEKAPDDYRNAGKPQPPAFAPEGIPATALNDAQKKVLWSLLETYSGNLAEELAAARMKEIKDAGPDRIYFAWAGATKPGVGHYYRVQGPTFVLELCNIQADPAGNLANHIHSVWRSLTHDFGVKQP